MLGGALDSHLSAEPIRLARSPNLSPDGKTIVFAYNDDVWAVPATGGDATRITWHPANDADPHFSPDGKQLAFTSDRTGSRQAYVMPATGGAPQQVTFHTEGCSIEDWYADNDTLLVSGLRDHHWRHARRFFPAAVDERLAEKPLFDAYGSDAALSPDGKRVLLVREGERWWRKGYEGSRAAQIWLWNEKNNKFTQVLDEPGGCLWPMWKPDGKGFYFVGAASGSFNLWEHDLKSKQSRQLTHFEDDSVVFPALSRDGSTIVFRHLFDLYVYHPGKDEAPTKLEIVDDGDPIEIPIERRALTRASEVAFSDDGLEMAFIAGGDLWVMDTVLKEPRQVTESADEQSDPLFTPDGKSILFISNADGESDIWKAERGDADKFWWQNDTFQLTRLTEDAETESRLALSPDGKHLAYVRGNGDLWLMEHDGKNPRRLVASFSPPDFDFSPDGKWIVYDLSDNDFNNDIWIAPIDGSREPFNVSRHPDNDYTPMWSPDGRAIAFLGRRMADEIDIYYVWLRADDEDKSSRERRLEEAIQKIEKARKTGGSSSSGGAAGGASSTTAAAKAAEPEPLEIDFDGLEQRVHRITVPNSAESDLFWSPDGKRLACTATVDGKRGIYTFAFPDNLRPTLLSATVLSSRRWLKKTNTIVGLADGVPASLATTSGAAQTTYAFRAAQEVDRRQRFRAGFDLCWRTMRDWWYDPRLGNRNWGAVRRKYREMAAAAPDMATFANVVEMMLGELNGSHLGFSPRSSASASSTSSSSGWSEVTAHLGVRFEPDYKGPGLKVRDVLPEGPASKVASRLEPGDVILAIDGRAVDPDYDLTKLLNGRIDRDIHLRVQSAKQDEPEDAGDKDNKDEEEQANDEKKDAQKKDDEKKNDAAKPDSGGEREVVLRPISYSVARGLLYRKWLDDNRRHVERVSGGNLGYLHIQAMNDVSFLEFERQLYAVGFDKDGLVIDVRENGGGSTTDHLLTVLTQPRHAITVPRGGGEGYPQDRVVYATWRKPIVVLCNQNSFSNAEIFSHAVKTLGRGKLVGVPTAGGVISTGAVSIMDLGTLRRPFRGWFVLGTGEDMELNGAVPDVILWPHPGDLPAGNDAQLDKAIELLEKDVQEWNARPKIELRYATERGKE
jgi:tricorn protease